MFIDFSSLIIFIILFFTFSSVLSNLYWNFLFLLFQNIRLQNLFSSLEHIGSSLTINPKAVRLNDICNLARSLPNLFLIGVVSLTYPYFADASLGILPENQRFYPTIRLDKSPCQIHNLCLIALALYPFIAFFF